MMKQITYLYITDKTGMRFFRTTCATEYKDSERRNLERHLNNAKIHPEAYNFVDIKTAKIVEV